jgi:hypothetical protein
MAGKALNSRLLHLIKFVSGGQESASKTATNHIQTVRQNNKKTLVPIYQLRPNVLVFPLFIAF